MSYGKVHDSYLEGEKIKPVSDRAALLGLYLIFGPHRTAIGCFRLGTGAITDIERFEPWGREGVSEALRELTETGFIMRDDKSGWTFITNALVKDPIKGPKAAVHAAKLAHGVPNNLELYKALKEVLSPQIETELKGVKCEVGWPMREPTDTPSMPKPSPDPDPEPQPEPQPSPAAAPPQVAGSDAQPADISKPDPLSLTEAGRRRIVGDRIVELCGGRPRNATFDYGVLSQWFANGWDPDLDIYPTVERLASRPGFKLKTMGYFTEAIGETFATRTTPVPAGTARHPRAGLQPKPPRADVRAHRATEQAEFDKRFPQKPGEPPAEDPLEIPAFLRRPPDGAAA